MTEAPCSDPTGAAWVHHILSRSGGMASVTWLNLFDREGFPVDGFIFADTGGEILETYTYLDVAREALAPYGIALTMVAMIGLNLYDTSWARPVIPPMLWKWSTRDYKVTPILRHYWALGGHVH